MGNNDITIITHRTNPSKEQLTEAIYGKVLACRYSNRICDRDLNCTNGCPVIIDQTERLHDLWKQRSNY